MKILIFMCAFISSVEAIGDSKDKPQEVHFDGSSVDGQARLPNGSSIAEARLKEILPLFELDREFQEKVYESIDHIK